MQKRKNQGKHLSPADEKYLQACHQQCKPVTGFWPQNEAAIADFVKGPCSFGDLPEKVCCLASYCRKRKQQGLPLTPAQERFFDQLVDVHKDVQKRGSSHDFVLNNKECEVAMCGSLSLGFRKNNIASQLGIDPDLLRDRQRY